MIKLEEIAKHLEQTLNGEELCNVEKYGLADAETGTVYIFNVCLDTSGYKRAERIGNVVTRYINAVMSLTDNNVEGVEKTTYNASVSTSVEFLIPLSENATEEEYGGAGLLSAVRELLTNVLQASDQEYLTDGEDITYLHTISYSIASTGRREQRELVGDSITLTLNINHQFVAAGVSSDAYKISISEYDESGNPVHLQRVRFDRAGFARKTVSESGVCANDNDRSSTPSSKAMPSSTVLTLNMDLITRLDVIDKIIDDYVFAGTLTPVHVEVERLDRSASTATYKKNSYKMILDTAGVNLQLNLASSESVTLVEYFE